MRPQAFLFDRDSTLVHDVPYGGNPDRVRPIPGAWRALAAVRAAGGSVDVVDLPAAGIRGNSHMIMMDRNSDEVAALVQDWLVARGL